jgi:hypothetical protein
VATAPTFTANGTTGTYAVTATVSGVGTPGNFSLKNGSPAGTGTRFAAATLSAPPSGGQALVTANVASAISTAYANVQQDNGNSGLSGNAIFGFRQNGVVVTEAGVPGSAPVSSGRIYVDVNGPVNTGIAFANPSPQSVSITFYFTDANGNVSNSGLFTLNGYAQTAAFLNEAPFNGPASFRGSFTFTSSAPVGVIALRGFTNERTEWLTTTLPVSPLPATPSSNTIVLPHFADGGGWTTEIVLTNLFDTPVAGSLLFFAPGNIGETAPVLTMSLNGVTSNNFSYTIQGRSSVRFVTGNSSSTVQVGSVQITPGPGGMAPAASAIFAFKNNGITVTEAGVSSIPTATAFEIYAAYSSVPGATIQSGVALANPNPTPVTVNLEVLGTNGISLLQATTVTLPGNGQLSRFIAELFPNLNAPFKGFLRVTATGPIGVTALRSRYNERNDFLITTTPANANNSSIPVSGLVFPQVVSGGGYTTEMIIYAPFPGTASITGTLWIGSMDPTVSSTMTVVPSP